MTNINVIHSLAHFVKLSAALRDPKITFYTKQNKSKKDINDVKTNQSLSQQE